MMSIKNHSVSEYEYIEMELKCCGQLIVRNCIIVAVPRCTRSQVCNILITETTDKKLVSVCI